MIKAALIDLDGTILDSMGMWETLGEDILKSLGFESKENLNEKFKSFTVKQAAEYYHKNFPIEYSVTELEKIINFTIEDAYINKLPLKKNAKRLLKKLKEENILLALVTTTNSFLAKKALDRLEVLKNFSFILSCEDLNCTKNDATIYNKAIDKLKINKDEVIVFEDALHAVKSAKNNNYLTVGVYDPYVSEQDKIRNTADFYIEDLKDIIPIINKIQEKK